MVRETFSRRSLLAGVAATTASVAGCTGEGSCRPVFDGIERVDGSEMRIYDVEIAVDERLYLSCRWLEGIRPTLTVFDPDEEPLWTVERIERVERIVENSRSGIYSVVAYNDSTANSGQWEMTVAAYRGWCSDVF